jgi:hypothetical protein
MADPVTLGVIITGLVGAYKAYTEYKATVVKAKAEKKAAPTKDAEAAKGEQAAPLVKAAVQQHGDAKDQRALDNFEDDPEMYEGALKTMLTRLADRSPAFAQQLQTAAQQANIQTGGTRGEVNVSGQGKVDQAAGVNTGTMNYQARDDAGDRKR